MRRSTDSSLHWLQLHLPAPCDPDRARDALTAMALIPRNPRVVLEAIGTKGRVSWRVGAEPWAIGAVVAALKAQLPDLRTERVTTDPGSASLHALSLAASVRLSHPSDRLPLRHEADEATTRQLLAALASAHGDELVRLQLVLGPRLRPRTVRDVDPLLRRAVTRKLAEPGFGCCCRIAARADSNPRAHQLVSNVGAALRGLEVPEVTVRLRHTSTRSVSQATTPWFWPLWLRTSDLVPFTGWPTAPLPLPGVPAPHPRFLPATPSVPRHGRVLGNSALSRLPDLSDPTEPSPAGEGTTTRPIALSEADSLRHLHLLGPTGTGKSTLMAHLALQDIARGHGVVVVDPKGDLATDIAARIPHHRLGDVVVIDAAGETAVGLDVLGQGGNDPDLAADVLLGVFHSLYADAWGPRTQDILHACLLTLARRGDASFAMLPLLLTNPGFRRSVTGRVAKADLLGLGSFWAWYEALSDAERSSVIAPVMNKLRTVLLRPSVRALLGQYEPTFIMSDVFTRRRILLVSLAKGVIGAEAARLLGSILVALLWQAALNRAAIPERERHPVFVHIDEVQDYLRLPGDLGDALAQARGLGVGFTLAHQHLGQLPPSLKAAILANARSRVAFALSADDAKTMAPIMGNGLLAEDLRALPAFHAYAQVLSSGTTAPTASLVTRPLPPSLGNPETVRSGSAARYGRPVAEVDAALAGFMGAPHAATDSNPTPTVMPGGAPESFGRRPRRPRSSEGGTA